jgi:RNA polymerase sigma-70 factor (ECF subfamily)
MFRADLRRGAQQVPLEDSDEIRAALEALSALSIDDPLSAAQHEQLRHFVRVILDHLPKRYGDALEWKYIQGLSVKEIGARLGLPPKATESVLTRARAAFREGFAALGCGEMLEGMSRGRP